MSRRARWKRGGGCHCSYCRFTTWGRKPAIVERADVAEGLADVAVNACDAGTCDDCADALDVRPFGKPVRIEVTAEQFAWIVDKVANPSAAGARLREMMAKSNRREPQG